MKKLAFLTFVLLLCCFMFSNCDQKNTDQESSESTTQDTEMVESIELEYEIHWGRNECTIIGIGTCTNEHIVIPSTINGYRVIGIASDAFWKCTNLTSVVIPDSVTRIGSHAFGGCLSLTNISIPDSVTWISSNAFDGCKELKGNTYENAIYLGNEKQRHLYLWKITDTNISSISIPEETRIINLSALENLTDIASITVDSDNSTYHSSENCLIETSSKSLIVGCKNSIIPVDGSVTTIRDNAFKGCKNLTNLIIPDSVTTIGRCSFMDCSGVTNITIGNGITMIGERAFAGCSNLSNIIIPDSVITIDDQAFFGCTALVNISIPNSVTSIGYSAFEACPELGGTTYKDAVYLGNEKNPYLYLFYTTTNNMTSISIHENTHFIGMQSVMGHDKLTTIKIPDQVIEIGKWAFSDCANVTDIIIPNSVIEISHGAFESCTSLKTIYYTGTSKEWEKYSLDDSNKTLQNATRYYYSETQPTTEGFYWRYVDGVPTAW